MGAVDFLKNEWEKIWKIIRVYGSYSVDRELIDQMRNIVPSGTLLEFVKLLLGVMSNVTL